MRVRGPGKRLHRIGGEHFPGLSANGVASKESLKAIDTTLEHSIDDATTLRLRRPIFFIFVQMDMAAGELEFGAFYAEAAGAPGASPGDLRHEGV